MEKEKPNYRPTGILAREANRVAGTKIILKYHEPAEARKPAPKSGWRLFVFKGAEAMEGIQLWERSCWLIGRERAVADILAEHPSVSGQHAVLQFRYRGEGGVRPYIMDLESAHGTFLNGERCEGGRYVELREGDVLRFGGSEREYVVMVPPKEGEKEE
ncbi:SMAD/FHA domain-containing protein [Trichodelitschia bisporula]|uniref:SMAD/FHA domain-containing protein n=1 Tax=Trichodelitschia bisporula TaxID=703511 RepID=A0A6G1HVJ4_9PEZI|nr:SMAD/FHA domain-containing protein [Trichodelitschia bisporula]